MGRRSDDSPDTRRTLNLQPPELDHDAAVKEIIHRDTAGAVVKSTGDGVLAVFSEPSTAVQRALEIQERMLRQKTIQLRIGMDMGQVSKKSEGCIVKDVFGTM